MVECPHCDVGCELVTGAEVYPHRTDLADRPIWQCPSCKARVGCHLGGQVPLGLPANADDRLWRRRAHHAFDRIWKKGWKSRSRAYAELARFLRIDPDDCHIGRFSRETCQRVMGYACLVEHGDPQ